LTLQRPVLARFTYTLFFVATILLRGAANISLNATWSQNGVTVFGDNGSGSGLNQLSYPWGLFVDDNATVYIADSSNNRIVKSKCCIVNGQVVAGGNGAGNLTDQLNGPKDVIVNRESDSLIICDHGNRRVMQWPLRCGTNGEVIISNIECQGLTMDDRGFLYVSDTEYHNVTRWRVGNTQKLVVAGGNEKGDSHNQLNRPSYIFVDRDYSVYVSDTGNHRIMKWTESAEKGIVVAGGRGKGKNLTQLAYPGGVVVDHYGIVYVTDSENHRIMRWFEGEKMGRVLVDGNVAREQSKSLYYPQGLSFDRQGNLYVSDMANHRIQRFSID
jgi:sugar lactone lactonase YvrE